MRLITLTVIFVALMGREESRPNSCFSWLSVQKGSESLIVEVCSSIAKMAMIRTRFHTHASVLGGLLTMFGMTDLPPPYRSSNGDVTGASALGCCSVWFGGIRNTASSSSGLAHGNDVKVVSLGPPA
jgi:hypothetical protein